MIVAIHVLLLDRIRLTSPPSLNTTPRFLLREPKYSNFEPNDPSPFILTYSQLGGYNYHGVYTDGQNTKSFKG